MTVVNNLNFKSVVESIMSDETVGGFFVNGKDLTLIDTMVSVDNNKAFIYVELETQNGGIIEPFEIELVNTWEHIYKNEWLEIYDKICELMGEHVNITENNDGNGEHVEYDGDCLTIYDDMTTSSTLNGTWEFIDSHYPEFVSFKFKIVGNGNTYTILCDEYGELYVREIVQVSDMAQVQEMCDKVQGLYDELGELLA